MTEAFDFDNDMCFVHFFLSLISVGAVCARSPTTQTREFDSSNACKYSLFALYNSSFCPEQFVPIHFDALEETRCCISFILLCEEAIAVDVDSDQDEAFAGLDEFWNISRRFSLFILLNSCMPEKEMYNR